MKNQSIIPDGRALVYEAPQTFARELECKYLFAVSNTGESFEAAEDYDGF